jgi:HK97 family phage portal protein
MNIFTKTINTIQKNFLGLGQSISSWQWKIPGSWSRRQQLEQYNRYVYTIVSAFAIDFAKTGYKMMRTVGETTQEINHDLIKLLEKPNPHQSGFQFRELHATYMKLAGESFWYLAKSAMGNPKEMYLLRPDLVEIKINKDKVGTIERYELRLDSGEKEYFDPEEIVHHKYPNPLNPWRGMGVIEAAMTYLQTEEYSSEWTKNSIYNSGRPSGILNLKGSMKDDQFKQLQEKFKSEYTGTANAGKTLLLKGFDGIDWAKLGMDLEGIDLKSVKDLSREDIMFMFRTSNTIMGITDDVNRANSREMRGVWMENVVKPELDRFVDQINHSFVEDSNLQIDYVDPNPETIADRVDEWTAGVDKWLTKNDIIRERNQILGTDIPEKEGGDFIWQPASLIPMDLSEEPEEELDNEPEEDKPVEPQESEEEEEEEEAEEKHVCEHVHKSVEKSLNRRERGELMRKNLFREQEQWEQPYQTQVNKVFDKQRKEILDRMKSAKSLDEVNKNFQEWLFDKVQSSIAWKEFIMPIATEILEAQSRHMFEFVDDQDVQGELELTPSLVNSLESRVERWSSDVDSDTIELINESISEGIRQGEAISKLRKRINEVYDNATDVRSERIARTETINLSNLASLEAMQRMPSVVGKEWMTNPGACEFCQPLDGMVVNLATNFVNQGEVVEGVDGGSFVADYEDVLHPPLHPNCRCTILPVNREQMRSVRLEKLENTLSEYQDMDKRTREAKEVLEKMAQEKEELAKGKSELDETLKKIEELIK